MAFKMKGPSPYKKKDHDEKKYPTKKYTGPKVIGSDVPFAGGGRGKLVTKLFNKRAKTVSKQVKQLEDMLKKSGYKFKSSPKSKGRGNL